MRPSWCGPARREGWHWAGAIATLYTTMAYPPVLAPVAVAVAALLAGKAWRGAGPRLYIGAVIAAYLAGSTAGWGGGPFPPHPVLLSWINLAAAVALIAIAWRLRLPSTATPLAAILILDWRYLLPETLVGWGVLALALGFAALLGGVVLNRRYRGVRGQRPARARGLVPPTGPGARRRAGAGRPRSPPPAEGR